jgi:catechol 2,3-dioxygenase-like lactoylglutathione lyase family enzyme
VNDNVLGFGHLCITVADIDRSLALYRDLLGFEVLMERDKHVPGLGTLKVVSLGSPSGNMELVRLPVQNDVTPRANNWHFSIVVNDIERAIDALSAAAIGIDKSKIDWDPNWIGGRGVRSVHFRGPDGEHLELEQFD